MSISTTATKDSYQGNNSIVTQYPITFKYFEESHISVYFDGVLQTKGAGADYVMGGDGTTSTGYITTNVAQAGTVTVAITLDVPFDQPVVLQETGSLPAKTIEVEGFDRLNMQVRRVWRKLQDVLTFNTDEAGASTGTADNLIGFDGSGDIAEIPNTTFVQTANDLSDVDAATARTNLNVDVAGTRFPLSELTDSTISTPTSGQLLSWNGSAWINTSTDADGGMLAGVYDPNTVGGDTFAMDNMVEGANTKILTSAERTNIGSAMQPVTYDPNTVAGDAFDSSNHAYTPEGTGSSATTVQTKLRERVSVKDYGAFGDNSTDDTAAINLAIADMNNGEFNNLYFPSGSYVVSSALTTITADYLSFHGDGRGDVLFRFKSDAGTNGTFFTIGDALNKPSDIVLRGIRFQCDNQDTLDGVGNAIIVNSANHVVIEDCHSAKVNGFIQFGSTSLGTQVNNVYLSRVKGNAQASAGGIALDFQSFAGIKIQHCNFSSSGVATSSFRGLYVHPQAGDVADSVKINDTEWNYPNADPVYVAEFDCTNNTVANIQFSNCVFDQAKGSGSACIYNHVDAGAVSDSRAVINFVNCVANASTNADSIKLDNTGGGLMAFTWVGGKMSQVGNSARNVYITGGNSVQASFVGAFLTSRSLGSPEVSVDVDDGCSDLTISCCTFGLAALEFSEFNYPVRLNGQVSNLVLTNNIASGVRSGLFVDWVAQPTTLFETRVIRDNVTPQKMMPYSMSVVGATTSTAATISLDDESAYRITARVLGTTETTTQRCMYEVTGLFYRDGGGVATLQGALVTPISVESDAGYDATLSVSNNDVILQLTSIVGVTTNFKYDIEIDKN